MTRTLYFDCLSGISGDMTLGALVDLGVDVSLIQTGVRSMGLEQVSVTAEEVKKKGFRAVKVSIDHPPEHAHRHLHQIEEMIDRGTAISDNAKRLAKEIFHVVAHAEAKVHGSTLQKVHFHEVGAIDSIADIVGTAIAIDALGVQRVEASPVPTGTGEVTIAHGRVSIPAPATAEILRGVPLATSNVRAELTTPTGAAILKSLSESFGSLPSMVIDRLGYGAGSMDLEGQANVVRVYLGECVDEGRDSKLNSDQVAVLECNVDDTTPEQLADACERLMSSGVLDVFQTPCTMKKGRAGVLLTVVSSPDKIEDVEQILFRHTHSIGVRRYHAQRSKLPRTLVSVELPQGRLRGKVVELPGGDFRFKAEYEDLAQLSRKSDLSLETLR
ncbi:MAG: nickel pincer cofactor biosynthesis protein LarC, partial [Planctomycetota bacterium]